jgi:hypothetical protein
MLLPIVGAVPAQGMLGERNEGIGVLDTDSLVAQLRGMAPIQGVGICADLGHCALPPVPPVEVKRKQVYEELYSFGASGVPALARLLQGSDERETQRPAVFGSFGGGWYFANRNPPRIDIAAARHLRRPCRSLGPLEFACFISTSGC